MMKIVELSSDPEVVFQAMEPRNRPGFAKLTALYLVTSSELDELETSMSRGTVPCDFAMKLKHMAGQDLPQQFIEQNCRLFIALFKAAQSGSFRQASPADVDRLLKVLAYVRKDDDLIPDYRSDGFDDDQREVRSALTELSPLLQSFKSWRLRHQVPGMWLPSDSVRTKNLALACSA